MREIKRIIASGIIISKDDKILMGQKESGSTYPDCWHIPGGGIEENETLEQTLNREIFEETGINIMPYTITPLPEVNSGVTGKTLKNGERVLYEMKFHRFEIKIADKNANKIELNPNGDLKNLNWFSKEELKTIKQIPDGKEFFIKYGYIKK